MDRLRWGALIGATALVAGAGVAAYEFRQPDPVPPVAGTLTVETADPNTPAGARLLADVRKGAFQRSDDKIVEVRVAWHLAAKPPNGCSVALVVLPDSFDVVQALQVAALDRRSSQVAKQLASRIWEAGWASVSGANTSNGLGYPVAAVLRDAGLPWQHVFSVSADAQDDTFMYVYELPGAEIPVDPTRFRGWSLMECDGDRVGPLTPLTVEGS